MFALRSCRSARRDQKAVAAHGIKALLARYSISANKVGSTPDAAMALTIAVSVVRLWYPSLAIAFPARWRIDFATRLHGLNGR
jgi:hypothetical protein